MLASNKILRPEYRHDSGSVFPTFHVPLSEVVELRIADIPADTNIEVVKLPDSEADYTFSISGSTVSGDLSVFVQVLFRGETTAERRINRIKSAFSPEVDSAILPQPTRTQFTVDDELITSIGYSERFPLSSDAKFRDFLTPALRVFSRLLHPDVRLFLCHATEDKPFTRRLAEFLRSHGTDVWLDEWEIRVGESIVQRIDQALSDASHLAILLSTISVTKPWVQREMSSALMRHLAGKSIVLLPVLIDDCSIPAILADIRYADCRFSEESGFREILKSVSAENKEANKEVVRGNRR